MIIRIYADPILEEMWLMEMDDPRNELLNAAISILKSDFNSYYEAKKRLATAIDKELGLINPYKAD